MSLPRSIQRAYRPAVRSCANSPSFRAPRSGIQSMSSSREFSQVIHASAGEDEEKLTRNATQLVNPAGRWNLIENGKGLEREFKFKSFKVTWDFMTQVAEGCKQHNHHPEWTNTYNKTHILWTTHRPEGLSSKDIIMAKLCDEAAEKFGEVVSSPPS